MVVGEYVPPEIKPFSLPAVSNALGELWLPRIADLPAALQEMAYHSVNRLIDYQDEAYAEEWLSRVSALIDRDLGSRKLLPRPRGRATPCTLDGV